MANRKGLLIGSELIDRQEPKRDLRRESDFKNLAGTREQAGQWVTSPEKRTGLGMHRFQRISNRTSPFLPTLVQITSLR